MDRFLNAKLPERKSKHGLLRAQFMPIDCPVQCETKKSLRFFLLLVVVELLLISLDRASLTKRAARLRALNQITQSITQHCGLPLALNTDFDAIPSPPHTPSEDALLDAADLAK